jgi:methionyl-tRNA formyltransferase
MNIVFMGTPDFAVASLARLAEDGHSIRAVFTQPDKPRGRGNKLSPPPVKAFALEHGIPVHQPVRLRDGAALELLRGYEPELIVVVAYGRILPVSILELPEYGCVNVHASLLPKLRGAAPIQRAIIDGETETGVTIMHMADGVDTGDIIAQRGYPIGAEETSGELFGHLAALGAELLSETLPLLQNGTAVRKPQDHSAATHAAMIDKSMAALDFTQSAEELCRLVRGLSPSPLAFARYSGGRLTIHKAVPAAGQGQPGEVLDARQLIIACGSGAVRLLTVQPEGKRPMDAAAFANSGKVRAGERLGERLGE